MSLKQGKEQIQQLLRLAVDKYERDTGEKMNCNQNPANYSGLTEKLCEISMQLPVSDPIGFPPDPNDPNKEYREFEIKTTQVRDAYHGKVNTLKPYFHAALNLYVYSRVDGDQSTHHTHDIILEKIGIIGFILAGVLGFIFLILSLFQNPPPGNLPSKLTETLNIIVLFTFYILIKNKKLNFEEESKIQVLAESLNIADKELKTARFNIDRVNKVTAQLCDKVYWFIIFLLLFYVLNLLEDMYPGWKYSSKGFPIMDFFENVFNALSAAFLYFGFKVLYDKTLDEKNNPKNYYKGTLLFLTGFIISYFFLLLAHNNETQQTKISNYYNLACGIYNGWAMCLLFGRLISMEYFFKDIPLTSYKFSKLFFHYGAIFILPVYVLANCLFGVQEFPEFNPDKILVLKSLILFVCFIGKGFFLLFIYHYINFKWLHIYVHIVLANNSIPRNIIRLINNRN